MRSKLSLKLLDYKTVAPEAEVAVCSSLDEILVASSWITLLRLWKIVKNVDFIYSNVDYLGNNQNAAWVTLFLNSIKHYASVRRLQGAGRVLNRWVGKIVQHPAGRLTVLRNDSWKTLKWRIITLVFSLISAKGDSAFPSFSFLEHKDFRYTMMLPLGRLWETHFIFPFSTFLRPSNMLSRC